METITQRHDNSFEELKGVEVTPFVATPDSVRSLLIKMADMPHLFDDKESPDPFRITNLLSKMNSVFYSVGVDGQDVGLIYFTDITPGLQALGHIMFWDKKLKGREAVALEVVQRVMAEFQLVRVACIIPSWNKAAQKFAKRIGMTLEGIARKATISRGEYKDLHLYSILKEELQDGRPVGSHIRGLRGEADIGSGVVSNSGPGPKEGPGSSS